MFHKDKRKYNIDNYKIYYLIIILLIFFNYSGQRSICSFYSNITIKIRGSGTQSIFYGGNSCEEGRIFTKPDEIYINDIRQTNLSYKYDLSQMVNTIKFVWKNSINNCNCLFKDCKNITYIDFNEFDFFEGLVANGMFYNYEKLISLNLHDYSGKIKILGITNMFTNCLSLTSLNLSNLDVDSEKKIFSS